MIIGFHSTQFECSMWQDAFDTIGADVELKNVQQPSLADLHTLLIWKPAIYDWRRAESLKHVIWLGAGMDTGLKVLPHVVQSRLIDAGMSEAMCEYAHYAVLYYQRQFDVFLQAQQHQQWIFKRYCCNKKQLTIGLLGLGHLGSRVASYFVLQGYPVVAWSRTLKNIQGVEAYAGIDELKKFLGRCKILINILPHTTETTHFLNKHRLKQLSQGTALISLSRGAIVDTQAMLELIDQQYLRGAFMDVFETEPLPQDSPLWHHPNITVTPHQSAPTQPIKAVREIVELLQ